MYVVSFILCYFLSLILSQMVHTQQHTRMTGIKLTSKATIASTSLRMSTTIINAIDAIATKTKSIKNI